MDNEPYSYHMQHDLIMEELQFIYDSNDLENHL